MHVNRHIEEAKGRYQLLSHPRILFTGRSNEGENLETQARQWWLDKNVHLLVHVPKSDLPALYSNSSLFAIASVCEMPSIPARQAIATGLPNVAV